MAKVISDHKINTALAYANAPISDLPKLKTLLDKTAAEHLHNLTVVDIAASQNLEQISTQLTTKQLEIDTALQSLLWKYNMKYQELMQLVNSMSSYASFDASTWSCSFTGAVYTNNNKHTAEYTQYANSIGRINALVTELISINGSFYSGMIQSTNIPANTWSQLYEYKQAFDKIGARQAEWMNIVNESKKFDHTRDMVLEQWKTLEASLYLFEMWQIPSNNVTYAFENANVYPVQVDRWNNTGRVSEDCISVTIKEQDGSIKSVQVKSSDCKIDTQNGRITISQQPEIFDVNGVIYKPKSDYEFELNVGVTYTATTTQQTHNTPLELQSSRKLLVKRSISGIDKNISLTAVESQFWNHLYRYIGQHISRPDTPHSEYKKMIMEELKKHGDFSALPEYHQQELFGQLVQNWWTLFGLIGTTDLANPKYDVSNPTAHPDIIDRNVAFGDYIKSKKVDPQPSADDMKSDTSFENWLSHNMGTLTKNFVAYHMRQLLDRTDIAHAINQQIINYAWVYEGQQLNSVSATATNAQSSAAKLRMQRPKGAEANKLNKRTGRNDSWLRLLAGKTATMSDEVKMEDGTEKKYTATLNTRTGKGMSVTLKLPDDKDLTLVAPTPGDLLAKILTSARIDESLWGQRMRLMMAFGTLKALVKLARDAGAPMDIPINGTRDEYRIDLDDNDNLSFARYKYNDTTDELDKDTPAFDEKNPDHKIMMTHNFITDLNQTLNTVLDTHYTKFKNTMSNGTSVFKRLGRFLAFDRNRMSYEADANFYGVRSLRGWMTKAMNRKQQPVHPFEFPIQTGTKQGTVSYDPKGIITITIDGKVVRKGKNLAKLVNPWAHRNLKGIFQRKDNITDGMEMQIMNGMYDNLTSQLLQNDKVSRYTYLVRDPISKVMYACYKGEDGNPRMGIIEHTDQNKMLLMDRQRWGRHVGIPEQGIRELNERDAQAVLSRPDIMDTVVQNMLKSREELIRVPVGKYRSASLTANFMGQLAVAGAVWAADIVSGWWLSTNVAAAAHATGEFTTGSVLPATGKVISMTGQAVGNAISSGWAVAREGTLWLWQWLATGTGMAA